MNNLQKRYEECINGLGANPCTLFDCKVIDVLKEYRELLVEAREAWDEIDLVCNLASYFVYNFDDGKDDVSPYESSRKKLDKTLAKLTVALGEK